MWDILLPSRLFTPFPSCLRLGSSPLKTHREGELVGPQNDAGTIDNALSGSGVSATCLESTWDLFSPSSSRAGHSVSILSIPAPPRHFFRGDQWPPPTLRWGMVLM